MGHNGELGLAGNRLVHGVTLLSVAGGYLAHGIPALAENIGILDPPTGDRINAVSYYEHPHAYTAAEAAARQTASDIQTEHERILHGLTLHVERFEVQYGFTESGYDDKNGLPPGSLHRWNEDLNPNLIPSSTTGHPKYINVPDAAARASLSKFNRQYQQEGIGVTGERPGQVDENGNLTHLPERGAGILVRLANGSDKAMQLKSIYHDGVTGDYMVRTTTIDPGTDQFVHVPLKSVIAFTEKSVPETLAVHVHHVHQAAAELSPTTATPFDNSPQPGEETIPHKVDSAHPVQQHNAAREHHDPRNQMPRFRDEPRHPRYHRLHHPELRLGDASIPGLPGTKAITGAITGETQPQSPDHQLKPQNPHYSINRTLGNLGAKAAIPGLPYGQNGPSQAQLGSSAVETGQPSHHETRAQYLQHMRTRMVNHALHNAHDASWYQRSVLRLAAQYPKEYEVAYLNGESCDINVSDIILSLGLDNHFPVYNTGDQYTHMQDSPLWKQVKNNGDDSNLLPGDILNAGLGNTSGGDAGHTAIYIGHGLMVVASEGDYMPQIQSIHSLLVDSRGTTIWRFNGLPPHEQQPPQEQFPTYYTTETNLMSKSGLSAEQLDSLLKNTWMQGLGGPIHKAEENTGINALYILSHAAIESDWGNSPIAHMTNNLFGWSADDANPAADAKTFSSYADCIEQWAEHMKASYFSKADWRYHGPTLHGIFIKYSSAHQVEARSVERVMNEQLHKLGLFHRPHRQSPAQIHRAPARLSPTRPAQPAPSTGPFSPRQRSSSSPTINPNPIPGLTAGTKPGHSSNKDMPEIPGVTPGGLYPNPQP